MKTFESRKPIYEDDFLSENIESVSTSGELADRLAKLTSQINKLVRKELSIEEDSARLHKLMEAFQKVLISDLDADKFSDMFSQTLVYGFFAARVHFDGKGEFSRRTAATILPKTNPFLRKLFREFADENMPDSLTGVTDELVELLNRTNIEAILAEFDKNGRNDAVVHFYESFLAAYDPELKKSLGVFYTPDSIVDYMARSLDEILIEKFGRKKGLADDKTMILDPALGTGSYINKIVDRIRKRIPEGAWDSYVSETLLDRIFGFEILMAPYAIAHLNIGLQLQRTGYKFERNQRLGVFLTNTLEETAKRSEVLFSDWLAEEAEAAASIKRDKPIMIVTGNPPYSKESQNDGEWIRSLMRGDDKISGKKCANYFECEGKPLGERNPKWLNDDYVKFMRFAHWRIEQTGHGILAFITNHGFLDNATFRGMRESLMEDFDEIYILDLHGNSKKKEVSPDGSKDENVFNIQTGVSINFLIKHPGKDKKKGKYAKVFRADLFGTRDKKFQWLLKNSFSSTKFEEATPDSPAFSFTIQDNRLRPEYETGIKVTDLFPVHSAGVVTARDSLTIKNSPDEVWSTVREFSTMSPSEAREHFDLGKDARDWRVDWAIKDIKESGPNKKKIVPILYRPFDIRHTYYTGNSRGYICKPRNEVMQHMVGNKNIGLSFTRPMSPSYEFTVLASPFLVDQCAVGNKSAGAGISYLAPLWVFEGKKRIANLATSVSESLSSDDAVEEFFHYAYATLNSTEYKTRYADFLRTDFPRVQVTADKNLLRKLGSLGEELISIHTLADDRLDGSDVSFAVRGSNIISCQKYDERLKRLYVNDVQYFENVSSTLWSFQIGGYGVLEKWLKDRKGQKLSHGDISYFERITSAIALSRNIIEKIDRVISDAGGWPLFDSNRPSLTKG